MNYTDIHSPKVQECARTYMDCYARYLPLSGYPGEYIEILYEDTVLPGHIYRSPYAEGKAPLLVITPGRNTWAEDTRWIYDEAIRRGIHCIIYDGPGQGLALRMQGLTFRPGLMRATERASSTSATLCSAFSHTTSSRPLSYSTRSACGSDRSSLR